MSYSDQAEVVKAYADNGPSGKLQIGPTYVTYKCTVDGGGGYVPSLFIDFHSEKGEFDAGISIREIEKMNDHLSLLGKIFVCVYNTLRNEIRGIKDPSLIVEISKEAVKAAETIADKAFIYIKAFLEEYHAAWAFRRKKNENFK